MNDLYRKLEILACFKNLEAQIIDNKSLSINGLSFSAKNLFIAMISKLSGKKLIYVHNSPKMAIDAVEDINSLGFLRADYMPYFDHQFIEGTKSKEYQWKRLKTIHDFINNELDIICVSHESLLQKYLGINSYIKKQISVDDTLDFKTFASELLNIGYVRVDKVQNKGEFAIRGDIVDVYSPSDNTPYRIELFGDVVDSIRSFDSETQRSLESCKSFTLFQSSDFVIKSTEYESLSDKLKAIVNKAQENRLDISSGIRLDDDYSLSESYRSAKLCIDSLENNSFPQNINMFASILFDNLVGIEDLFSGCIFVYDKPDSIIDSLGLKHEAFLNELSSAVIRASALKEQENLLRNFEDIKFALGKQSFVVFQDFSRTIEGFESSANIDFSCKSFEEYSNNQEKLAKFSSDCKADLKLLLSSKEQQSAKVESILQSKIPIINAGISKGFYIKDELLILSANDFFPKKEQVTKRKRNLGQKLDAFTDLMVGDYVVHEMHGIGIYRGVKRVKADDVERDYLLIDYKGTDQLYVPIEQFDRVQKYIGSKGDAPNLNSLGSKDFQNKKRRVKQQLKELAFDLVKLYAKRQSKLGTAFLPLDSFESEFNDDFPYELTEDQTTAASEILLDMERPQNMDRLLCGDVGYGKTELAMRAAFRAVINGKQVAVLAPTTILARQHYLNFKARFEKFSIKTATLSRFNSTKENKKVIDELSTGTVDIVIGTHRLLSKDVKYKDLGLLIVDEEQRFGVAHKEQIKALKNNLDVLTLSATPIPRTLHMSLVGIRDMSVLETPPENRFPIQSYVLEHNEGIIKDAVMREINRGGQVFFLYNRVFDIDSFAIKLKALIPEAKIGIAHGQMSSSALEDVMLRFCDGEYNLLLCTTIIENGIDIPNANTLIVYNADHLGLSQLYQIRGRVGRSSTAAYAYFTVKPNKVLSEQSEKRLQAIKDYTDFGAGFKIAMRDLEIRGAGDIFGAEQSGQISQIGYDLYCKLIEEAVLEAQGNFEHIKQSELETRVELHVNAFIPASYIESEKERLELYKKISYIKDEEDCSLLIDELIDRFGEPPSELINLMNIAVLKSKCNSIGCELISYFDERLSLRFDSNFVDNPSALVYAVQQSKYKYFFSKSSTPTLLLNSGKNTKEQLLNFSIDAINDLISGLKK